MNYVNHGQRDDEFAELIIENGCIECREFYIDLRESICICDRVMETISHGSQDNPYEDGHPVIVEWERKQKEIVGNMTKEEREETMKSLPECEECG